MRAGNKKEPPAKSNSEKQLSAPRICESAEPPALSFCLRDSALRPCTFGTRFTGILQSSSAPGLATDSGSFDGYALVVPLL